VVTHGYDGSSPELGSLGNPMIRLCRGSDQNGAGEMGILTEGFTSGSDDRKEASDDGAMRATFGGSARSFSCSVRSRTGS
jgi:hypothetical protein